MKILSDKIYFYRFVSNTFTDNILSVDIFSQFELLGSLKTQPEYREGGMLK